MTTTNDNGHQRDRLAHEFTRTLKEWATPEQWATMVKANAEEPDSNICHSHDFCDANMAMDAAFRIVLGRGCTLPSEVEADPAKDALENQDMALWNAAWAEAKRIWQAESVAAPDPVSVREMTAKDIAAYGVPDGDAEEGTKFWLAKWPDREGWYEQAPGGEFMAGVFSESETFKTAEETHAWLWARVEVNTPPTPTEPSKPAPVVTKRLYMSFVTVRGNRLLGRSLDAVRANGDHPNLERYYDEADTIEIACHTDEREEYEREMRRDLDSDTLNAEDLAALVNWMADNAGLRLHCATAKDRT